MNLCSVGLWPVRPQPLQVIKDQVAKLATVVLPGSDRPCRAPGITCPCGEDMEKNLVQEVQQSVERIFLKGKGMCLDCVKRGLANVDQACRVPHDG